MPMPRIEHVEELDPDHGAGLLSYPVITGDYSRTPRWESVPVQVGAKVEKPTPVFTKLDPRWSRTSSPGWPRHESPGRRRLRAPRAGARRGAGRPP